MRHYLFSLSLLLLSSSLFAQPKAILDLAALPFEEVARDEFSLGGAWLQSLFTSTDNDSKGDAQKGHIRKLYFLRLPGTAASPLRLSAQLEKEGYEMLTSFRSSKEQVYFLAKENNAGITDLVAFLYGEADSLITIYLSGLFRLEQLADLNVDLTGWPAIQKASRQ